MNQAAGGEGESKELHGWGRWFGRPGRSLTRRLIWLASVWIVIALAHTGWTLTSQYEESVLRRLGNVLNDTLDEVVLATDAGTRGVSVAESANWLFVVWTMPARRTPCR